MPAFVECPTVRRHNLERRDEEARDGEAGRAVDARQTAHAPRAGRALGLHPRVAARDPHTNPDHCLPAERLYVGHYAKAGSASFVASAPIGTFTSIIVPPSGRRA